MKARWKKRQQQHHLLMWAPLTRGWGDPDVGSFTSTDISARREPESKRPIKTRVCENILTKKGFVKTLKEKK